jgi:hypothetical protein
MTAINMRRAQLRPGLDRHRSCSHPTPPAHTANDTPAQLRVHLLLVTATGRKRTAVPLVLCREAASERVALERALAAALRRRQAA